MALRASVMGCVLLLAACSSSKSDGAQMTMPDASTSGAADGGGGAAGTSASMVDANVQIVDSGVQAVADASDAQSAVDAGFGYVVGEGDPIAGPMDAWSYVPFADAFCANGTSTGIAVNLTANPEGALFYVQGGGACWDAETCLVNKSSIHLEDTVGSDIVLPEAQAMGGLFDRSNATNPFKKYVYVYVPYCTGDLHSGRNVATYTGANGAVAVHHLGAYNMDAYLARLVPTIGAVPRVVFTGVSAGGFGATINWWRFSDAFQGARVDVLDDAGLFVDPKDARYTAMVAAWNMVLPPGCDDCAERFSAWLPYYGTRMHAPNRYALMGFLGDAVIGDYFGLSAAEVGNGLYALRAAAAENQKTLFLPGANHTVIGEAGSMTTANGLSPFTWIMQFANDDVAWDHAGP